MAATAISVVGAGASAYGSLKKSKAVSGAAGAVTTNLVIPNIFGPGGSFAGTGNVDLNKQSLFNASDFAALANLPGAGGPIQSPGGPGPQFDATPARAFVRPGERGAQPTAGGNPNELVAGQGNPLGLSANASQRANANRAFQLQPRNTDSGEFNIGIGLGDREVTRQALVQFANQSLGRAGIGGGLPQNVIAANAAAQQQLGQPFVDPSQSGLDTLSGVAGLALGQNFGQFNDALTQGFQRGFSNDAFGAAGQQLANANQSGADASSAALANLRAQAQPENQRAVNSTLDRLFAGGRLGTTGGANVVGRLAEAQNQQDLGFQLAALNEGRASQQNAASLAGQFQNLGASTTGLSEQLLQGAFGRFNNTLGLAGDLSNQRFGRSLAGQQFNQQSALANLQNQIQLAGLGTQLQSGNLNLGLQALQGEGALQQQGLDQFATALNAGSAGANARIGSGSNLAALASNPNFGGNALTAIGGAIANNSEGIGKGVGAVGDFLKGIFGGGGG